MKTYRKMHSRHIPFLSLFVFCLIIMVYASNTLPVSSLGHTRDQAIKNGLKSAVCEYVTPYLKFAPDLSSRTRITESLSRDYGKYVRDYSIVPNSERREFGFYKLVMKIRLNEKELRLAIGAFNLIQQPEKLPRIMVVISETRNGQAYMSRTVSATVEGEFLKSNYQLIDFEQLKMIESPLPESVLVQKCFTHGADFLVTGTAEADEPETTTIYGMQQFETSCAMALRVIRTDDARLAATVSISEYAGSSTSGGAVAAAMSKAASKAAKSLSDDLFFFWADAINHGRDVELVVYDIHASEISSLEKSIRNLNIADAFSLKFLEDSTAHFSMRIKGGMQAIRKELGEMGSLSVTSINSGKICARKLKSDADPPAIEIGENLSSADIEITDASLDPVYPVACGYYQANPLGKISIANTSDADMTDMRLTFSLPELSRTPFDVHYKQLSRNSSIELDLVVPINCLSVANPAGTQYTNGIAMVEYRYRERRFQRTLSLPATIYGINAVDWSKPGMICSFITPADAIVKTISNRIAASVAHSSNDDILAIFAQAAGLYYACKELGIQYVRDPTIIDNEGIVDQVNFPVQTLRLKAGDCDDTSVLLATFLESIGIETALILYPGHILLMFNTGVHAKNGYHISVSEKDYCIHNGMVWIPIETTGFQTTDFIQAWKNAALEFSKAVDNGTNPVIIETHQFWNTYPANSYSENEDGTIRCPDTKPINDLVRNEMITIKSDRKREWAEYEKELKKISRNTDSSRIAQNRLAILQARNGELVKAKKIYDEIIKTKESDVAVLNNSGNVYCLLGKPDQALAFYKEALKKSGGKPEYLLNIAFCFYTWGSLEESTQYLHDVLNRCGKLEIERITGIRFGDIGIADKADTSSRQNKTHVSRGEIRNLIKKVLDDVPADTIKKYSKNILPVGNDPARFMELVDILWWEP